MTNEMYLCTVHPIAASNTEPDESVALRWQQVESTTSDAATSSDGYKLDVRGRSYKRAPSEKSSSTRATTAWVRRWDRKLSRAVPIGYRAASRALSLENKVATPDKYIVLA